jgi:hypothetical protein
MVVYAKDANGVARPASAAQTSKCIGVVAGELGIQAMAAKPVSRRPVMRSEIRVVDRQENHSVSAGECGREARTPPGYVIVPVRLVKDVEPAGRCGAQDRHGCVDASRVLAEVIDNPYPSCGADGLESPGETGQLGQAGGDGSRGVPECSQRGVSEGDVLSQIHGAEAKAPDDPLAARVAELDGRLFRVRSEHPGTEVPAQRPDGRP